MRSVNQRKKMGHRRSGLPVLPVIFALGYIPLLVHTHSYQMGLSRFDWYPEAYETVTDVFLFYKSAAIMLLAAGMTGLLLFYGGRKKEGLSPTLLFTPSLLLPAGLCLLFLLSGIRSVYPRYAFLGSYEVFEPVGVLVGYLVFFSIPTVIF